MPIRLMNDYGAARPLWNEEGLADDGQPPLPDELEAALRAWVTNFNAHFSWDEGWPSAAMERAHRAEGERLLAALREALPDDDVTFDYWEEAHR